MERIEKLFDSIWGVLVFYVMIALIAILITNVVTPSSSVISQSKEVKTTYYA